MGYGETDSCTVTRNLILVPLLTIFLILIGLIFSTGIAFAYGDLIGWIFSWTSIENLRSEGWIAIIVTVAIASSATINYLRTSIHRMDRMDRMDRVTVPKLVKAKLDKICVKIELTD